MIKFHLVQFFLLCEYAIFGTEKVCFGAVFLTHPITVVGRAFRTHLGIKWYNLRYTSSLWSVIKKFDSFGTVVYKTPLVNKMQKNISKIFDWRERWDVNVFLSFIYYCRRFGIFFIIC